MFVSVTVFEVRKRIMELKKHGKPITNFYPGILSDEQEVFMLEVEGAIVFVVQEENRKRAFFVSTDDVSLQEALRELPSGVILENVYREDEDPLKNLLESADFKEYATYMRETICYHSNPYLIPETGRRAMLQDMYDTTYCEYGEETDAEELCQITKDTFDPLCDDVFTLEKWKEVLRNRECMVYRENGKIVSYYVWRLEGRKLYGNISVNKGPANYLYNLERFVFEQMWEKGIRVFYAWYNEENIKALRRSNKRVGEAIKTKNTIYNGIYIKR